MTTPPGRVRAQGEGEAVKLPPVGTPAWTEADDAKLRSLAVAGMNAREIAAELNRSLYAVQNRSKKLGISFKQVMIRRRLKKK
jgi:rRNA maturation endonuclease Nob1